MKTVVRTAALYGAASLLCLLLLTGALKLWKADLAIPFSYEGDCLPVHAWIKGIIDNGWFLHNDRLGAPAGQDMHDFPIDDNHLFLLIKLLAPLTGGYAATVNVFFLATFLLVSLSALFVLRRFGVSYGPALVCSLLYAFLPYHFQRGQHHLFLSCYFLIPPLILVCFWIYRDQVLFFETDESTSRVLFRPWRRRALAALVVCLLASGAGIYYVVFSCYFLALAGLACSLRRRRAYPLVTAAILIGALGAGTLANEAPNILYHRRHGPNPQALVRDPSELDKYGLRLTQLLLPVSQHRLPVLARLRHHHDIFLEPSFNERGFVSLGVAGSIGFLLLLCRLLLRAPAEDERAPGLWEGLTFFNLFAILLATVGGIGPLAGVLLGPWIRAYNRVSIFIAFFALAALALLLERLLRYLHSARSRWIFHAVLGLFLVAAVLDQTTPAFVPHYDSDREHYASDEAFVRRIEEQLPTGAMVFQLPSLTYPEGGTCCQMYSYDPLRAYLHSRTLRWSHGSMKGRPADALRARLAPLPPAQLVDALVQEGFRGLYIDRNGYADRAAALERELTHLLGSGPMLSQRQDLSFFDLGSYSPERSGRPSSLAQQRKEGPATRARGS